MTEREGYLLAYKYVLNSYFSILFGASWCGAYYLMSREDVFSVFFRFFFLNKIVPTGSIVMYS